MMYDNTEKLPRAILVAVDTGEYDAETSLLELEELARTAGVEVAATSIQKRPAPDSATVVGSGRLRELTEDLERLEADMPDPEHRRCHRRGSGGPHHADPGHLCGPGPEQRRTAPGGAGPAALPSAPAGGQ